MGDGLEKGLARRWGCDRAGGRPIETYTVQLARALHVIGLMNVQHAIQGGKVYVLEVNPRASRTVPYVSKATGVLLFFVKSPVFPFNKFPGVDPALGPEMRSGVQ